MTGLAKINISRDHLAELAMLDLNKLLQDTPKVVDGKRLKDFGLLIEGQEQKFTVEQIEALARNTRKMANALAIVVDSRRP
jgi:hypothetical protein